MGARNLVTLQEIPQKELDTIAKDIRVLRPRIFSAKNFEECKKVFESLKRDDEGVVLVDANFNRVKMKQESYLKLSKIRMLKEQDLFDCVLGKMTIDVEYLNAFPDIVEELQKIRSVWEVALKMTLETYATIKNSPTRKEFAMKAIPYPYKGLLFSLLDGKDVTKERILFEDVKIWNKNM